MYRVSGSRSCPLSRKRQTTHKSGSLSQDKNLLVLIQNQKISKKCNFCIFVPKLFEQFRFQSTQVPISKHQAPPDLVPNWCRSGTELQYQNKNNAIYPLKTLYQNLVIEKKKSEPTYQNRHRATAGTEALVPENHYNPCTKNLSIQ